MNRVEFGGTRVEIPMDTPLYYMLPIGTLEQVKEASGYGTSDVRSVLNPALLLGQVNDVQLYYDTRGLMTIPEKQMLVEIGRKGPGGTKNQPTIQLPKDLIKHIAGFTTEKGKRISGFGGKRKTKSNRTNKRRKTKRR